MRFNSHYEAKLKVQIKKLKVYQIVEATCSDIVSEGLGISHIKSEEYKPLTGFILGVMPGETFLAKVTRVKSNHFLGVVLPVHEIPEQWIGSTHTRGQISHETWALFNVSGRRVKPSCDIFTFCGSCKMLQMSYEDSIDFKKKWLKTQLERSHVNFGEIKVIESPRKTKYRNHVQIHINKHAQRGFYAPYSYTTRAFPQQGCLLFDQALVDQNFPDDIKLERCVRARIDYIKNKTGIWSLYSKDEKNQIFPYTVEYPENSSTTVNIPNSSFFQTNTSIIPLWLGEIQKITCSFTTKNQKLRILELFCGFGFISRMLSYTLDLDVIGIDILTPKDLQKITMDNTSHTPSISAEKFQESYIQHDLSLLDRIKNENMERLRAFNPDIIIFNPPRSGFIPEQITFLLDKILESNYKNPILYSSCNGATFARDAACLVTHGFSIDNLTLLDFFPWTSHYEILGLFKKNTG